MATFSQLPSGKWRGVIYQFVTKHPELSVDDLYAAAGATGSAKATGIIGEYAARLPVGKTEAQKLYREACERGYSLPVRELRIWARDHREPTPEDSSKSAGVPPKK